LSWRQDRVFEAEPQPQRDEPVGRELVGRGRNAAGRDRRPPVDQQYPHSAVSGANQSTLRQAARDGTIAAETASVIIRGTPTEPRAFCWRSGIGHEQAERQKWTDCDVLVVHKALFGQR
jgi:hypothetical protein